jgi:copper(I)-binding protein
MKRQLMLAAALALFAAPALAATHNISVTNVWSRPAIETGVVYFTIRNHGARTTEASDFAEALARHVS